MSPHILPESQAGDTKRRDPLRATEDHWGRGKEGVEPPSRLRGLSPNSSLRSLRGGSLCIIPYVEGTWSGVESTVIPHVASRSLDSQASL